VTYRAVVYETDASHLYVIARSEIVSFTIVTRVEKERILRIGGPTSDIPFIDAYFQATVLADEGLFEDAETTLASQPAPTIGLFAPRIKALRDRIRDGLGFR
jgi:hypothetical protein